MPQPRALLSLVPVLLASFASWACSEPAENGDDGGTGATAGVSGASAAGSSGTAGTAAGQGAGGAAGSAGSGTSGGGASGAAGSNTAGFAGAGAGGANSGAGGSAGETAGSSGASGAAGSGGSSDSGGNAGTAGSAGTAGIDPATLPKFSFFVTSVQALISLSGSQDGFGGDLRFGETGEGAGLRGADKICTAIAETSMEGSGAKGWHAFLSARAAGPGGTQVDARDRIGSGPWYDRNERLISNSIEEIIGEFRPGGADPTIENDLPNEYGIPNHGDGAPGCTGDECPDNHDTLTGSAGDGTLYLETDNPTCDDWTTIVGEAGEPRVGHSWPRLGGFGGGMMGNAEGGYGHWISSLDEAGCAPGIFLVEAGPPGMNGTKSVGDGGGYGGFYCFAMMP